VAGGWILSAILTATGNIPPGSRARTDLRSSVLSESSWFRVPYPGNVIIAIASINTRSTIFYENGK
jgi:sugar/nucleoside kinase (ribokinase family)